MQCAEFIFRLSSFWSSRCCAADALVATAAVENLKMWPQILTSEKRFIFTTPSSLFTAALQKNPKLFCLSWVYGVYSISKLFLFVQTFIQEKITFLRCTTAKQKWKKSIWIFLVEFSHLSRKWEKGVANWIRKPKLLVCVNCQNNVEVAIKSQGNDS